MQGYACLSATTSRSLRRRVFKPKKGWRGAVFGFQGLVLGSESVFSYFARVHRVEESTWFFLGFWFSITCNLSVGSYKSVFSYGILCFRFPNLAIKVLFLKSLL